MGKTDELIRSAGASISQAARTRPAPAAMPEWSGSARVGDAWREGLGRSAEYWLVPLDRIDRDVNQPREGDFDQAADELTGEAKVDPEFQRLVDSLQRDGLLQPITVVANDQTGRFKVHLGERRFRAALSLGWDKIPARVLKPGEDADSGESLAKQIIENVIRADLKPIEQARSFQALLTVHGWSMAKLGEAVGYSAGYISQRISLLGLPEAIQAKVTSGELDAMRAYHVSQIRDEAAQTQVVDRIVGEGLSRRETEEVVKQVKAHKGGAGGSKARGKSTKGKPARLPTERAVKLDGGFKVTVSGRKGFDLPGLLVLLEEATAKIRGQVEAEKGQPDDEAA
jgi:ParB family transcriptional regulator, chromosome partitioning protein